MGPSMDDDALVTLGQMIIGSTDTLTEKELPTRIPPTWNDSPPLLRGPRDSPETPQLLKGVLRQGVPPPLRCAVWLSNVIQVAHPHQESSYWHEYRTLLKAQPLGAAYDTILDQVLNIPPVEDETRREREDRVTLLWQQLTFDKASSFFFPDGVTDLGRLAHKRVCMALQRLLGLLDLAPMVPSVIAILLTVQSESYAFCAVREMAHASSWYFPVSDVEEIAWGKAFGDIMGRLHPQTAEYLEDRGVWEDLSPFFRHFFSSILPMEYCRRIMDIYTLEGSKVLFRFGVALCVLFKIEAAQNLLTISKAKEWWHYMKQWANNPSRFHFESVVRKAYGMHGRGGLRRPLGFPRRRILDRIIRVEEERAQQTRQPPTSADSSSSTTATGFVGMPAPDPLGLQDPPIKLHPEETVPRPQLAVTTQSRAILAEWMPLTMRMTNMSLLFSTNTHGRSLEMFYNRVRFAKRTILLCEVLSSTSSDENYVVGMYAPQVWRPCTQVYGDGSCFLFRLQPKPMCWKWSPNKSGDTKVDLSDTSRNNDLALLEQFMVSTHSYISLGGNPDGSAGLRFNDDFTKAESSPAVGFANEPLHGTKHGTVFEVGLVEVYGLVGSLEGRTLL